MASGHAPSRNGVDCPAYSPGSGGQTDSVNGCCIQQVTWHGPLLDGAVEKAMLGRHRESTRRRPGKGVPGYCTNPNVNGSSCYSPTKEGGTQGSPFNPLKRLLYSQVARHGDIGVVRVSVS